MLVQGQFALHVASRALEYYAETVFKVPYPLKKSDLLAIPGTEKKVGVGLLLNDFFFGGASERERERESLLASWS